MKDNKKTRELIIGILLLMPLYLLLFYILKIINLNYVILVPILMYIPIIIGIILSYKCKLNTLSKILRWLIVLFCLISIYNCLDTYYGNHPGFDGFTPFFWWNLNTAICRGLSLILYWNIAGWKKSIIIGIIYLLLLLVSYQFGLWS